jgi:hypothetical protein
MVEILRISNRPFMNLYQSGAQARPLPCRVKRRTWDLPWETWKSNLNSVVVYGNFERRRERFDVCLKELFDQPLHVGACIT